MWRIYENIGARGGHFLHKENKDEKIEDLSVFPSVVDQSTDFSAGTPGDDIQHRKAEQGLCWDGRFWMENSHLSLGHNGWDKTMSYTVFYTKKI
jgi:hypothetical protein